VVGASGLVLIAAFYVVLLACMPAVQRKDILARSRVWLGRLWARGLE
jgi:hypothetical protein